MVLDRIDALESQIRHLANIVETVAATTMPPINRDVPYVSQVDETTLHCTMGNWLGEPTGYTYQWKRDATNVGAGTNTYTRVAADGGHSLACLVTAANANGSTVAPLSNAIAIPAAAAAETAAHAEPEHRAAQRK